MSHAPNLPCKHDESLSKINNLMIDIKLHLSGVRIMSDEKIENLDRAAEEIRIDLERCKDFGIRY